MNGTVLDNHPGVTEMHRTGSSYVCNPPVTDTDIDFHVLVNDLDAVQEHLRQLEWEEGGSGCNGGGTVYSWRKNNINLILIPDRVFFDRLKLATELAKRFNLLNKQDRIDLFQAVADDYAILDREKYSIFNAF